MVYAQLIGLVVYFALVVASGGSSRRVLAYRRVGIVAPSYPRVPRLRPSHFHFTLPTLELSSYYETENYPGSAPGRPIRATAGNSII